jgi:hypothetical protein
MEFKNSLYEVIFANILLKTALNMSRITILLHKLQNYVINNNIDNIWSDMSQVTK